MGWLNKIINNLLWVVSLCLLVMANLVLFYHPNYMFEMLLCVISALMVALSCRYIARHRADFSVFHRWMQYRIDNMAQRNKG